MHHIRYQNVRFWHHFCEALFPISDMWLLQQLRYSCTRHPYSQRPLCYFLQPLVQWFRRSADLMAILRWTDWMSSPEYKKTFLCSFADIDEQIHPSEPRYGFTVAKSSSKWNVLFASHFNLPRCPCIRCGSRTDISRLISPITTRSFGFTVILSFERLDSRNSNCSYIAICGFTAGIRSYVLSTISC